MFGTSGVAIGRFKEEPKASDTMFLGDGLIKFCGALAPQGFVLEGGSLEEGWVGKVGDRRVQIFWDPQTSTSRYLVDGEMIEGEDIWVWFSPMYQSLRKDLHKIKQRINELYYAPGMPGAALAAASFINLKGDQNNPEELVKDTQHDP